PLSYASALIPLLRSSPLPLLHRPRSRADTSSGCPSKQHRCKLLSLLKFLLSAALTLGLAAPAAAQLYSWRDSNGHLVVSNTRQADGSAPPRTYAVPQSTAARPTPYVPPTRSRP